FCEFFAGIGLMRIALERHGWKICVANDIDPGKYRMYAGQFRGSEEIFNLMDIHKLSAENVPACAMATASFPCNDLSLAGSRTGLRGKSSSAFWGFMRLLRDMDDRRPAIVLVENVMGFLTSNNGRDLNDALVGLNQLGYSVDIFMVDAAWFVPQSRKRLFIVAQIEDPHFESKSNVTQTVGVSQTRPKKVIDFINSHRQISWRLKELPKVGAVPVSLEELLEDLPDEAPEWWNRTKTQRLLDQVIPGQKKMLDSMIVGADWTYRTAFRRTRKEGPVVEIRSDGIAGCLRTSRGGSARQILVKAGRGKFFARLLTPRECSRLMGADDYNTQVSSSQALMGFGDAVCVPVIEWITLYRLNPLVTELIRGRPLSMPCLEKPGAKENSSSGEK
ncbi:MAG: DNA (cytosine-5-)-methyltransferase, partial [Pseudomonadota bacterium]